MVSSVWLAGILSIIAFSSAREDGRPNRVTVDLVGLNGRLSDDTLDQLQRDLLLRLLEAGHGVGHDGATELSLGATAETFRITCEKSAQVEHVEVEPTDPAVLTLELVHRAVELTNRCAASELELDDGVYIDDTNLSAAEQAAHAVTLADYDLTLVGSEDAARWRLCVSDEPAGATVTTIDDRCDPTISVDELAADPVAAIERWLADESPEEQPRPATSMLSSETKEPSAIRQLADRRRQGRWHPNVSSAGGFHYRLPGTSATLLAGASIVHTRGTVVGIAAQLMPSRAAQLSIVEALTSAHIGRRVQLSSTASFHIGLGFGVLVHRSRFPLERVEHVFEPAVQLPLRARVRLTKQLFLTLGTAVTWIPRPILHQLDGTVLWRRGSVSLDALTGLSFDWLDRGAPR